MINNFQKLISAAKSFMETSGQSQDGFDDPDAVFPKREYINAPTTNSAARGTKKNKLYTGGGDVALDLELDPLPNSQYPLNQVRETVSGHVTEIDDTPGSERMLFKHRTGAGIEMRPDGTVIISSTNNTIQITGGDQKVIVEGDGEIVYNGNLKLNVSGDFDLEVGGDMNIRVAGDVKEDVLGGYKQRIVKNYETTTQKNRSEFVTQTHTQTILGDQNNIIKGQQKNYVNGDVTYLSGGDYRINAKDEIIQSSPNINIAANDLTVIGDSGTFGGEEIVYYGKTAHIPRVNSTSMHATTFHGSLVGKASFAEKADEAGSAPIGPGSGGGTLTDVTATNKATVQPTASVMNDYLNLSNKGVIQVNIDPSSVMYNQIDKTVDYGGISNRKLTTAEIRSKMRDPITASNSDFTSSQVLEGKLSSTFANITPPSIGRIVSNESTPRRGKSIIGNAPGGAVKRFKS